MTSPVKTCDVHGKAITDVNAQSGCNKGTAYMSSSQVPWAINDNLAYGFTAVSGSNPSCCSCYQLTFTSGEIKGKKMIVQATNTGGDVGATQFDLAVRSPTKVTHQADSRRYQVEGLASLMVVVRNGVLPQKCGARSMEA